MAPYLILVPVEIEKGCKTGTLRESSARPVAVCEWCKRFVFKQKITLNVRRIIGERVRVKQRGWDALNRTQTARSYSAKHSQFIFVTAGNTKNHDFVI